MQFDGVLHRCDVIGKQSADVYRAESGLWTASFQHGTAIAAIFVEAKLGYGSIHGGIDALGVELLESGADSPVSG